MRGMAAVARQALEEARLDSTLVPQESRKSMTGYCNVIEVGGKYQARLQVKGDGRGGQRKRKQCPVPGIFDSAYDAALYLAYFKKAGIEKCCDENGVPFKLNKVHKKRCTKPVAVEPAVAQRSQPIFAMATYSYGMLPLPLVAVGSPLPMQPLGYSPPFPTQ